MNSKIHQVTSFFGGALAVAVLCLLLAGCGFARAEKKGLEVFPDVQKFNQLFDKTNHKIDCHGGIGSHLSWGGRESCMSTI